MNEENRNIIIEKINNIFVDDFNVIKESQVQLNEYLQLLNISDVYNYNNFCIDFIKITKTFLENTKEEDFNKMQIDYFISQILSEMIKIKIIDSELDSEEKTISLMKLELDKYLYHNDKKL